jgi:lysophospholipase
VADVVDLGGHHLLRYAYYPARGQEAGVVLLLEGRGTFIEYYSDLIENLRQRQFSVWVFDWFGQGGSGRAIAGQPRKQHLESFDTYHRDLVTFVDTVMKPKTPFVVMGYSMGGHMALRYAHDHPERVAAAVLISPMMRINTWIIPPGLLSGWCHLMTGLCFGQSYVWGQSDRTSAPRWPFSLNPFTSDSAGFATICRLTQQNPELTVGGVTLSWLQAALQSMRDLNREMLRSIPTPVLMMSAGDDRVLDASGDAHTCAHMPRCQHKLYSKARHEIFRETPEVQKKFWQDFDAFIQSLDLSAKQNSFKIANQH